MPKNTNLPAAGRGGGYAKEVRDRVHALLKEGKSPSAAGREVGIRATTIWGWYRSAGKNIPKESLEAHQIERKKTLEQARDRYKNMSEDEKRARRERKRRQKGEASPPHERQTTLFSQPTPPALPPPSRQPPSSNGAPPGYVQTFMPNSETAIAEALRTALDERDALKRTLEIYQRENDALKRRLNEGR